MSERDEAAGAAENLQVIRSLMERATVYRAISRPIALFGGGMALFAYAVTEWKECSVECWAYTWVVALVLVCLMNVFIVAKKSRGESKPFWSHGLKLAVVSAGPALVFGGVFGFVLAMNGEAELAAGIWVVSYGLSILATGTFAPCSLRVLGLVCFLIGFATCLCWVCGSGVNANFVMMIAFGVAHLVYGAVLTLSGKSN